MKKPGMVRLHRGIGRSTPVPDTHAGGVSGLAVPSGVPHLHTGHRTKPDGGSSSASCFCAWAGCGFCCRTVAAPSPHSTTACPGARDWPRGAEHRWRFAWPSSELASSSCWPLLSLAPLSLDALHASDALLCSSARSMQSAVALAPAACTAERVRRRVSMPSPVCWCCWPRLRPRGRCF